MVKKIVLVILFSALVILAFMQYDFFESKGDEFIGMLDDIEREIKVQDQVHARAKADEFISLWMETKPKYEALCEHDEVDKIQACVEQFSVLLDQRNPLVFTQTALLKYYYSHITDIDSFAFENIF